MIAFGGLEIDAEQRQVRYCGREIATQPLVFDLLLHLALRPDTVVTKEELVREVWKGTVVSDSAISQAMSLLRRTLRKELGSRVLIRTVWGRGYRFVAETCADAGASTRKAIGVASNEDHERRVREQDAASRRAVLVDRARERALLEAALRAAVDGRGGVVVVSGEPGIGKTRLVREVTDAGSVEADVLWGACWEGGGAPAFWAWAQVLRAYQNGSGRNELREMLGTAANLLSCIVPELASPAPPNVATAESKTSRIALLEAVWSFLARAAARRALVLVFDDVHAADLASLRLLGQVARHAHTMPLLLVVTHRDAEVRRSPDVARILGDISREATHLPLRGLSDGGVGQLVSESFQVEPTLELVRALQSATGGNPFLLEEVMHTLVAEQALHRLVSSRRALGLSVPAADLIARRLDLLSPAARDALRVAALIGAEFSLRELSESCTRSADDLLAAVHEAVEDGILVAKSLANTRFAFRHALFREALESELSVAERVSLHCVIGEAIERLNRPHLQSRLDSLAHHFLQGAPQAGWKRAVEYAEAAAAHALQNLAYEDADAYLEAALDLFEAKGSGDQERRCELLLGLGACRRKASGLEAARPVFARAADIARSLGNPDLLARSALGFTPWTSYGLTSEIGARLLEEALAAQPRGDSALKAALLARVAHVLDGTAGIRAARAHIVARSRQAVRMARRTGDLPTLGRALFAARWVDWDPASFVSRRAMSDELLAVAHKLNNRELAVIGEGWRIVDHLEDGDPSATDEAMRRHSALASELREPEHLWWNAVWRAMRAILEGRHALSEELVAAAHEIGQRVDPENAFLVAHVQYHQIRAARGELAPALAELEDLVASRPEIFEGDATVLCRKARLLAGLGRSVEAQRELDRVAVDDFKILTMDMKYPDNLAALAVTCSALGDQSRARFVYQRLRAANGRNLVFGPGVFVVGPAAHYQGMLAAVLEHHDAARRHFESALAMSRRMGWIPSAAQTQLEYASALLRRGRCEDRAAAGDLLDDAERAADALGLERLAITVRARRVDGSDPSPRF